MNLREHRRERGEDLPRAPAGRGAAQAADGRGPRGGPRGAQRGPDLRDRAERKAIRGQNIVIIVLDGRFRCSYLLLVVQDSMKF